MSKQNSFEQGNTNGLTWVNIFEENQGDEVWEALHAHHKELEVQEDVLTAKRTTSGVSYYYYGLRDEDFPPVVEERISNFTDDFYAFNWSTEEQMERTYLNHDLDELPENWPRLYQNGGIPWKTCTRCHVSRNKTHYSKRQWRSTATEYYCNECLLKVAKM